MKAKLAVAALFSAAVFLTPAEANSTLTITSSFSGINGTSSTGNICLNSASNPTCINIGATGWDDILTSYTPSTNPSFTGPAGKENLKVGTDGGLGLANAVDNGQIGIEDGIVLDFANVPKTLDGGNIANVTIVIQEDNTGTPQPYWTVYGSTTATNGVGSTLVPNGSGKDVGYPTTATVSLTVTPTSFYDSFVVGLTDGGCSIDIQSISVEYSGVTTQSTPEPGTFVMAGLAFVALGVTMRKRRKKA